MNTKCQCSRVRNEVDLPPREEFLPLTMRTESKSSALWTSFSSIKSGSFTMLLSNNYEVVAFYSSIVSIVRILKKHETEPTLLPEFGIIDVLTPGSKNIDY